MVRLCTYAGVNHEQLQLCQLPTLVTVVQKVLDSDTGRYKEIEVPRPVAIEKYTCYMGGVDKSD